MLKVKCIIVNMQNCERFHRNEFGLSLEAKQLCNDTRDQTILMR